MQLSYPTTFTACMQVPAGLCVLHSNVDARPAAHAQHHAQGTQDLVAAKGFFVLLFSSKLEKAA